MNIGSVVEDKELDRTFVAPDAPITEAQVCLFLGSYKKRKDASFPEAAQSSVGTFVFYGRPRTGAVMTFIEGLLHELDTPAQKDDKPQTKIEAQNQELQKKTDKDSGKGVA
jgi:hypothetical protein